MSDLLSAQPSTARANSNGRTGGLNIGTPRGVLGLTAGAMVLHVVLLFFVPFEEPSTVVREVFAALALLPGGVLMGALFPLGIARVPECAVGASLLADALGTLVGYTLLFVVFLPLGWPAFAATSALCYLVAAALVPRAG